MKDIKSAVPLGEGMGSRESLGLIDYFCEIPRGDNKSSFSDGRFYSIFLHPLRKFRLIPQHLKDAPRYVP